MLGTPISALMTRLIGTYLAFTVANTSSTAVDPVTAIQSWQQARQWVDQNTPDTPSLDPIPVEGVHITLSHNQRPVAWATSTTWAGATSPVSQAVAAAIQSARQDSLFRNLPDDLQNDALSQLAVEVEVAGPLEPITAPTLREAANTLSPATDGLALRVDRNWIVRFPSYLRMTGDGSTYEELKSLAIAARMSLSEMDEARRTGNVTLYRFKTVDLLQDAHTTPARLYIRGEESPRITYDREQLTKFGDRVANRLTAQLVTPELEMEDSPPSFLMGDYDAAAGRYANTQAPLRDHMLAALALHRWQIATGADAVTWSQVGQSLRAAALESMSTDPIDVALHAMLMRSSLLPIDEARSEAVLDLAGNQEHSLAARSIAALGMVDQPALVEQILIDATEAPPSKVFNALPWIGWLDQQHAQMKNEPLMLSEQWRAIEYMMVDRQHTTGPLQGAIGLNEHVESISAHMLRPLAFYISMHPSPAPWTVNAIQFISTLIVPKAYHPFRGESSADGIRMAPWDDLMPIWAQAMTLLCVSEMLQSGFAHSDHGPDDPSCMLEPKHRRSNHVYAHADYVHPLMGDVHRLDNKPSSLPRWHHIVKTHLRRCRCWLPGAVSWRSPALSL